MSELAARAREEQEQAGHVTREAAVAAWWAPRLGAREPVGLEKLLERPVRTDEERERWRAALEEVTAEHLRDCAGCGGATDGWHLIQVDYDPDALLQAAAERAGITLGRYELAGKTLMVLDDEGIRVSDGYGAPFEVIWRYRAEDDEAAAWLREQAEADLAAAGSPDEAARSQAVLAVIAKYEDAWQAAGAPWALTGTDQSMRTHAKAFKKAVRMVAYGYRHRPGWKAEWAA